MTEKILLDFLPEIVDQLHKQLEDDEKRWGNTWKTRPAYGQELRAYQRLNDYFDQWKNKGVPIPWLKVMGEAMICLVRENHREEYKKEI